MLLSLSPRVEASYEKYILIGVQSLSGVGVDVLEPELNPESSGRSVR